MIEYEQTISLFTFLKVSNHPSKQTMMVMVRKLLIIESLHYVVLIATKEFFLISFFFSISSVSSNKVTTINIYS
jgi:hypothetical protein